MKSVLIIGIGTVGEHLANKMQELGNDVMIVDKSEERIQELSATFKNCFVGDCENEGVLRSLGVNNFDYCFVTVGQNSYASLEITSSLKELGAKHVVSKAQKVRQAEFLRKVGADEVFFPEREIAEKLAVRYTADNIFDYIELTSEYSIFEIPILKEWKGKNIIELNIRNKYNINIIAIKHGEKLTPLSNGDYRFQEGDHILIIGKSTDAFRLSAKAEN
ncbi:MAG: TrkA family potassium uptake protein [Lachnospiraceae bacterium]|nr:TrkA family potassium uptake protein [Lachnospiraceae bacterium]